MSTLWSLMVILVLFTFVMSAWRSPVVSLMPDITPGPFRSQANGIVNLMGGVGSLLAFAGGGLLFKYGGYPLPFLTAAILMLAALAEKKSLLLILFGVFFWFAGYNAIETFFTLYATNTMDMDTGSATMMLSIFSLTFMAFAVPAGFIGAKIGRRKTILIGLAGIIVLFVPLIVVANFWVTAVCLFGGGFFWTCVNINSLPIVVRLSGEDKVGTFIGYYYFFSFAAQIASPILFGALRDLTGNYQLLFLYFCVAFAGAMVCLLFVRHGEEEPEQTSTTDILEGLGD